MDLDAILVRAPINRTARSVVRQTGAREDSSLSKQELVAINDRLLRKQRLLKLVLGIQNNSQHRNLIYKMGRGQKTMRARFEPRAALELLRIGNEMQRLQSRLAELKNERRQAYLSSTTEETP